MSDKKDEKAFKETIARDFLDPFLTWIDSSGPKNDPLLVFKFFKVSIYFWRSFVFLDPVQGRSNGYLWNIQYKCTNFPFFYCSISFLVTEQHCVRIYWRQFYKFQKIRYISLQNCLQDSFAALQMCKSYWIFHRYSICPGINCIKLLKWG